MLIRTGSLLIDVFGGFSASWNFGVMKNQMIVSMGGRGEIDFISYFPQNVVELVLLEL